MKCVTWKILNLEQINWGCEIKSALISAAIINEDVSGEIIDDQIKVIRRVIVLATVTLASINK